MVKAKTNDGKIEPKNNKENKKGFTLIELLAVIIILGVLMLIAIPSVTQYISNSRKKTYISIIDEYATGLMNKVNSLEYPFTDTNTTYYVHINNIPLEKGGKSPFGNWKDAYAVVVFDGKNYDYYWTSIDTAGYKILLKKTKDIKAEDIMPSSDQTISRVRSIGFRNKIYIIDKDGNIIQTDASLELAREEAKECFIYSVSGANATITGYQQDCPKEVIIPSKIEGYTVTEIGSYAFDNRGITKVILPEGLIKIGEGSFRNNKLTSITIPSTVTTIGAGAFSNNLFTEIVLPSTVTSLGGGAFANNKIPEEDAFIYKLNANGTKDYSTLLGYAGINKNIVIPDTKEGVPLKTLADGAFRSMALTSIVIPDTVEYIGSFTLAGNSFTTVILPSNLKTIASNAFRSGKLTNLTIPASVTSIGSTAFNGNQLPPAQAFIYARTASGIDYSKIVSYGGAARANVEIPSTANGVTLKTIGTSAFSYNSMTGSITIPASVTNIETRAFAPNSLPDTEAFIYARTSTGAIDYTKLNSYAGSNKNPKIPEGVKIIASSAFSETSITTVTLPQSLTTIEGSAFSACYLTQITIPPNVTSLATNAMRKENTWGKFNQFTQIINQTGRSFNWGAITGDTSKPSTFVTGTVDHAGGNIIVKDN